MMFRSYETNYKQTFGLHKPDFFEFVMYKVLTPHFFSHTFFLNQSFWFPLPLFRNVTTASQQQT